MRGCCGRRWGGCCRRGALLREFMVRDGAGRMRIAALATDAGVYAEVSNFLAPVVGGQGDYCVADGTVAGLFRFGCDVDLFYSDIEQIMVMSRGGGGAGAGGGGYLSWLSLLPRRVVGRVGGGGVAFGLAGDAGADAGAGLGAGVRGFPRRIRCRWWGRGVPGDWGRSFGAGAGDGVLDGVVDLVLDGAVFGPAGWPWGAPGWWVIRR